MAINYIRQLSSYSPPPPPPPPPPSVQPPGPTTTTGSRSTSIRTTKRRHTTGSNGPQSDPPFSKKLHISLLPGEQLNWNAQMSPSSRAEKIDYAKNGSNSSLRSLTTTSTTTTKSRNSFQQHLLSTTTSATNTNQHQPSWLSLTLYIILLVLSSSQASNVLGSFNVEIISLENPMGFLSDGVCCSGENLTEVEGRCSAGCRLVFEVCLSHYQADIPDNPKCKLGNGSSQISEDYVFSINKTHSFQFPFKGAYFGDFLLVIKALHKVEKSSHVSAGHAVHEKDPLIIRANVLKGLAIGTGWANETYSNGYSTLKFRYQAKCEPNQYGPKCLKTCKPRNDKVGHYKCDINGTYLCMPKWEGEHCDRPSCRPNCACNETTGICKCSNGWQGDDCKSCVPFSGCLHGTCSKPFGCDCKPGWGGPFCNQDMDFCATHKPCINGGSCTNVEPGTYKCQCLPGFNGKNCEHGDCRLHRQKCNHGLCELAAGQYRCTCSGDYEGELCDKKKGSMCSDHPCQNDAVCEDINGYYRCSCKQGFIGGNCDIRDSKCFSWPCQNGGTCLDFHNSFTCLCPHGYTGEFCQSRIDSCASRHCSNNGTCIEKSDGGFECECSPGFTGFFCDENIDDCVIHPCANGGTCVDRHNSFHCHCTPGFTGPYCEKKKNTCHSVPCLNGGTCYSTVDSFYCQCPPGFCGIFCENPPGGVCHELSYDQTTKASLIVAVVLGVSLPLLIIPIVVLIAVIVFKKHRKNRSKPEKNEEMKKKSGLSVISTEETDNNLNQSHKLNNKKINEKSSQVVSDEMSHFLKYNDDEVVHHPSFEPPDLRLHSTFHRNLLNPGKSPSHHHHHHHQHHPASTNDSNVYRAKVPTKYKQINKEVAVIRNSHSCNIRQTEV